MRAILMLLALAGLVRLAGAAEKKLIEWGWDEPGTAFMRAHAEEMEQTPFDGCVFHIDIPQPEGKAVNFTWQCWGQRAFAEQDVQPAIEDLKAIRWQTLTDNFLRFNVCPGDVDWFGDFSAVVTNAGLAGKVVGATGCRGILFDIEQYNSALFNYPKLQHADTKSFEEYAAQVRQRGRELMEAFQAECPELTIFLSFGYCLSLAQVGTPDKLPEGHYGLLPALYDGMLAAAGPGVRFVDGHELSYPYKERAQFEQGRRNMAEGVLPFIADVAKYKQSFRFAFGIWMDCAWRQKGWNVEDFKGNHFQPVEFEQSVGYALSLTDEYVWIYTEQPRWWSDAGPQKLPAEYVEALVRAKRGAE